MTHKPGPKPVDRRAIRAWKEHRPSSPVALATRLKVTPPAVSKWPYVPRKRTEAVAQFLGLEPWQLRPDIYAPPASPWAELSTSKGTTK